jgi:hypothetical protein
LLALLVASATAEAQDPPASTPDRPRLIVLTDISSLTPRVAEPDDGQSLVRLMLYTNDFDIEGWSPRRISATASRPART